jgi:acetyl-CoA acetyltransferase family protein
MSNENYSVIVDGIRSPIVLKNSPLLGIRSDDLTALIIKKLLSRNSEVSKDCVDDLVVGCAFPEGPQGMLMAKGISILSDLPLESAAKIVNRFCGSSMDAAHQVSQAVQAGDYDCGIAAGVEDMFSVPMGGFNPSFNPVLYENEYYIGMGDTAENLAKELDISRDDQEAFAIHSHEKALAAIAAGKFKNEIVPINFNGVTVSHDEGPRQPNIEKIQSLNPAFDADGTITAATSSPVSLGAASLIITSNRFAESNGINAKFRIKSRAVAGVDWRLMGAGPLPATEKALSKADLSMADIDTIELNEAFAAQSLYVIRKGGWDIDKININGGAIALGHPLGCSGARLLVTLMNVMEQNDTTHGLATMCIGSGQGIATIIERIN